MNRHGVTLLELIVVLAIVAVIASVTTLSFRRADFGSRVEPWVSAVAAARRTAIDSNRAVTLTLMVSDTPYVVTALPDGSIVGDTRFGFGRLDGDVPHAP